jgi:uncharacterized protein (TIGR03083 family)
MQPLTAVHTAALFPELHQHLIAVLRGLAADDWKRPTLAPAWTVREVAAHLLDGDLRRLSLTRDGHRLPLPPPASYQDIVALINDLNTSGVAYAARLSPQVVVDLLEVTGGWVSSYVASLPPDGDAAFAVAWAGEQRSENWMDVGREYTERWHHQMQIREAVGADPVLLQSRWLAPLLDLSVRAFQRAYADVDAPAGTLVVFAVEDDITEAWSLRRDTPGWTLLRGRGEPAAAMLQADPDTAWKLLYNEIPGAAVRARVRITGDERLIAPMLASRAVMV